MPLIEVAKLGEIPEGKAKRIIVKRNPIAVFHCKGGEYYAIDDTCTHAEVSLAGGVVEDCTVICPLHGAAFDLKTGEALSLPAVVGVETYPVKIEGDTIYVEV
jgi:3-phenylpropionate/trans-cinnamate dioxygenase ferredoxin subunit